MKNAYRKQLFAAAAVMGLAVSGAAMANFDGLNESSGNYTTYQSRWHHDRQTPTNDKYSDRQSTNDRYSDRQMPTNDKCANVTGDLYTKCRLYGGDEK